MDVIKKIRFCGILPVMVIEDEKNAVPAAKALLAGGIDVLEVTLRTPAALEALRRIASEVPEASVGAGTVINRAQAEEAAGAGASFIVSPGFDVNLAKWCIANGIPAVPGCVTPTEITQALDLGIQVLKFFPANVYGGLSAIKALAGPFGTVRFIPTGGIGPDNVGEYSASPYVHAVGGSWICPKEDITGGNTGHITALSRAAIEKIHGFEFAHLGINTPDTEEARNTADGFGRAFLFSAQEGQSSVFAGPGIEVMKTIFRGKSGHIGIRTNSIERASAFLEKHGFSMDPESAKMKNGRLIAAYLKDEIGGFAIHLLQKM